MNLPDLTRIVDTYISISKDYFNQLRSELIPPIRKLQKDELLNWFSFLIHPPEMLDKREPLDNKLYIHILLEPKNNIDINEFIKELPEHFLKPEQKTKSNIAGFICSFLQEDDWAYAWKLHGEASEYVLSIIENHKNSIPIEHIIQLLHFITNPLTVGGKSLFFRNDFMVF